ncbi:MAG: COX15/CtaA family protein [Gemmatimonadaceae bacterium]|nr:COX15/CtaA family protein [Gemmatimonadaceae bacterium]
MNALSDRRVRRWLLASAAAVVLAVAIGGITRLTESGLSITEWKPVSGILPPMSSAEWNEAYTGYLAIPEAQTVHRGITLSQFQALFWWEWVHRLLARLVGLILAVPYFVLLAQGHIRKSHRRRLILLPILAAAQGALGWYMVKSGLEVRTDVSPYRLTAHLGMALIIYIVCVWTAMSLRPPTGAVQRTPVPLRRGIFAGLSLTILTVLSGGFVAGLDAGKIFNTFPLMGGKVVPPGYMASGSFWHNAFENPIAAQFHHRVLALSTATVLLALAAFARRLSVSTRLQQATDAAGVIVLLQIAFGITTLLLRVPVAVGVLHQVTALAVLTAMLVATHRA